MDVIVSEFFAGKRVSVHGDTLVFNGAGECLGQEDEYGELQTPSPENVESLVALDYVNVEHRADSAEGPAQAPADTVDDEPDEAPVERTHETADLDELEKDDLLAIAETLDLDLDRRYSNATIIEKIEAAQEE